MKIWITGIAGFLGAHLADALIADGHEIWGNDNLICSNIPIGKYSQNDCCDFVRMLSAFQIFKPEVVVHCAATAHEGLSNFSPSFVTKNIYEASVATFSAAIASGVKRIVFMSSMARYGKSDMLTGHIAPFQEEFEPNPIDPYGIAKVAAENTLHSLCRIHNAVYTILIPHNIIGTRQRVDSYRNVATIMINRCLQGKPPLIYGDGKQTRCFSPIKDCIPSIIAAIDGCADGKIVNIGPDEAEITIEQLAYKIIDITGYHGKPEYIDARPNEVKHAYCTSDRSRRLLGYLPKQSIDDCLKEMVDNHIVKPFEYDFPIEITDGCPKVWTEKML